MDISGPYKMLVIGSKFWVLIVDDKTRKAWSFFVKHTNEAEKVMASLLTLLKGATVVTKYLRCDNAGENVKGGMRELCDENGIQLELIPPHSPQINGVMERKFVTIRDRAHAMMMGAQVDEAYWKMENAVLLEE
jgi:transposase InsO family protein